MTKPASELVTPAPAVRRRCSPRWHRRTPALNQNPIPRNPTHRQTGPRPRNSHPTPTQRRNERDLDSAPCLLGFVLTAFDTASCGGPQRNSSGNTLGVGVLPLIVRQAYTSAVEHLTPYSADTFRTHQDGELGHRETQSPRPKVTNVQGFVALRCPVVPCRMLPDKEEVPGSSPGSPTGEVPANLRLCGFAAARPADRHCRRGGSDLEASCCIDGVGSCNAPSTR